MKTKMYLKKKWYKRMKDTGFTAVFNPNPNISNRLSWKEFILVNSHNITLFFFWILFNTFQSMRYITWARNLSGISSFMIFLVFPVWVRMEISLTVSGLGDLALCFHNERNQEIKEAETRERQTKHGFDFSEPPVSFKPKDLWIMVLNQPLDVQLYLDTFFAC